MKACFVFDKKSDRFSETDLAAALESAGDAQSIVWINLLAPSAEDLLSIGGALSIHELTMEDIENPRVRPKVEEFENYLFVVFKALNFNEGEDLLDVINLNFILLKNTLVSVHLKPLLSVKDSLEELRRRPDLIKKGPAFIMHGILDRVVDRYFPLMDELDEETESINTRIFEAFDPGVSSKIYEWKTKIAHLRRRVGPQREILMNLANRPQPLIPSKVQVYFRDVYDHIIRIHDYLESYRDIMQGAMDSYMTQVSNRMNEVMKVLSIVATVMLPLGILTGLYGTNFEVLPGSKGPYAFWIFLSLMLFLLVGATIYFKKRKWF